MAAKSNDAVSELYDEIATLKEDLAALRKVTEDFLATWGTYYTQTGQQLRFLVTDLYKDGTANGVAFGYVSGGAFLLSDIPMGKNAARPGAYWEPVALPKSVLDEFGAVVNGADSKEVVTA